MPDKRPRVLVASAARYDFGGKQTWINLPPGDRAWQREVWRLYDQIGEFRYAIGWKARACAQAYLYAADVDPLTGKPMGATKNARVQKITDSILGGPVKRPQKILTIALNLEAVGEVYVIVVAAKKTGDTDRWLVISTTEVQGDDRQVEYVDPETGVKEKLGRDDLLIRMWVPHPRLQLHADAPTRALIPTLREIEKTSQNIAARLDSRLVGAGVFIVPAEVDFADDDADDDAAEPGGIMGMIAQSFTASLSDPGSAASQVPIVFKVASEHADAFRKIDFETPLSKEIIALRQDAINRLATGLDLPREVVEGMGQSNHWSAWQVAEETYRTHLAPLLDKIADSLSQTFLIPMLVKERIANPETYMCAFDGTELIAKPDQTDNTLNLYDKRIITDDAVRQILNIPEEYAPTEQEKRAALAVQIVTGAPTTISDPEIRKLLQLGGASPAVQALPVGGGQPTGGAAQQAAPVTASADMPAADLAVRYALERAGNRLTNNPRLKREFAAVPPHEVHVRLRPPGDAADLLAGAWRHVPVLADRWRLDDYTLRLLVSGVPHSTGLLGEWMASCVTTL